MNDASRNGGPETAPQADLVIVHSSDLHVDDGYTARMYGGDGTVGLRCVLDAAVEMSADVVLLAGDVFEHNRLPLDLLDKTAELLADAAIPVVMLPGNHDPAIPESAYRRGNVADPSNVHVLGVTHDQHVLFEAMDLEIWGHAHFDYSDMTPLRDPRPRSTRWQIAMAHGHYDAVPDLATQYRPSWLISDEELAATAADYVALGHWNTPMKVGNGAVHAYYSGSPDQARTVNVIRLTASGDVEVTRAPVEITLHD